MTGSKCSLAMRGRLWVLALWGCVVLSGDVVVGRLTDGDRSNAFIGYSEASAPPSPKPPLPVAEGCTDDNEFCKGWADSGECKKNPGFMEIQCAASCEKCQPVTLPELPAGTSEFLVMGTQFGEIRIRLRPDLAPNTVAQIRKAANRQGSCLGCRFYRAEKIPPPGKIDNFGGPGPPYALLQGSLPPAPGGWKPVSHEVAPLVQRGMVCLIGSGPDFFIAVGPHKEWGHAHTVWGEVVDMTPVDEIIRQPVKEETWGQTHVTTLVTKVPYTPRLEQENGSP